MILLCGNPKRVQGAKRPTPVQTAKSKAQHLVLGFFVFYTCAMLRVLVTVIISTASLQSVVCQERERISRNLKKFNVDGRSPRMFNQIIRDSLQLNSVGFESDGILIGLEKISRSKLTGGDKIKKKDREGLLGLNYSNYLNGGKKAAKKGALRVTTQGRWIMMTHWGSFDQGRFERFRFNIYQKDYSKNPEYNVYQESIDELKNIAIHVDNKIKEGGYTHVVLMSTGWNCEQRESIRWYKDWLYHLANKARKEGKRFKPFFVGISWPSVWRGNLGYYASYFQKATDADEIGLTYANRLIWKALMPSIQNADKKPELVLIGHSFGGRILTRAAFSNMLFNKPGTGKIDYLICAEGAFSAKRFYETKRKRRIGIYSYSNPVLKLRSTHSINDRAVKWAVWAPFMGKYSSKRALRKGSPKFSFGTVDRYGTIEDEDRGAYVHYDARDLIWYRMRWLEIAHNDVLRPEFSWFIYNLLNALEGSTKNARNPQK